MNRLGSIQRLRALAALSVALFHACQWSGLDFAVGAAGVDVFFVISGFVLWAAVLSRAPSPGAFLAARFARVAPLYWLATLATAALALWRPQAMSVAKVEPLHLLLSLLFIPHNDPAGDAFPLLASGWTLTYEAFFYLALAAALAFPRPLRLRVLCAVVLAAASLGLLDHRLYPLLANPMLLEFLAGVGLAQLWTRGLLRPIGARGAWGAIAAGWSALVVLQVAHVRDDFWRPLLWGPPAVLLVAGAVTLEAAGWRRRGWLGPALERLGDASYSLYLCQLPVICAFCWIARDLPAPARAPIAFALAVLAGLACCRFVETPLRRAVNAVTASGLHHRRGQMGDRHGHGFRRPEQVALAAVDPDLA